MQAPKQSAVQYYETVDHQRGMVQAVSPFPASWSLQTMPDGMLSATGPGGVRLHPAQVGRYGWSHDPFARDSIAMSGQQLAPPASLQEILQQHVQPAAAVQGSQLVLSYPIPEVEGFWARFTHGMVQSGSRRQVRALGADFSDGQGTLTFVSIVQMISQQNQIVIWTLQTTSLEASADRFENAKVSYLYAVGNTQINPRWQQMMNGQLQGQIRANESFAEEMMARSQAAHQQRMAAIQSYGNTARSVGQTYSDILDISHAGYLKRDDMNSAGQAHLVDTIGERALIANHETGEHYQVDAGSKFYWVGNDGTYFGTDNPLYDPRTDNRVNDVEWTKFVKER